MKININEKDYEAWALDEIERIFDKCLETGDNITMSITNSNSSYISPVRIKSIKLLGAHSPIDISEFIISNFKSGGIQIGNNNMGIGINHFYFESVEIIKKVLGIILDKQILYHERNNYEMDVEAHLTYLKEEILCVN